MQINYYFLSFSEHSITECYITRSIAVHSYANKFSDKLSNDVKALSGIDQKRFHIGLLYSSILFLVNKDTRVAIMQSTKLWFRKQHFPSQYVLVNRPTLKYLLIYFSTCINKTANGLLNCLSFNIKDTDQYCVSIHFCLF